MNCNRNCLQGRACDCDEGVPVSFAELWADPPLRYAMCITAIMVLATICAAVLA